MSRPSLQTSNREWQFRIALLLGFLFSIAFFIALFAPLATGPRQNTANPPVPTMEATVETPQPTIEAQPTNQSPYIFKTGNYATWNYTVTWEADQVYEMQTSYDKSSVQSINAYAAENRQLAATLEGSGETVQVKVTFRRAIAPEEYRSWVLQTGFVPSMAVLRLLSADNSRASSGISPEGDDVLPEAYLRPEKFPQNARIEGVYIALGTISTDRLEDLESNRDVFLADVTPAIVRNEIAQMVGNSEFRLDPNIDSPFWFMEDYGLQNFQQ